MHITLKGQQLEVGEALRGQMESALAAAVSNHVNSFESHIVFTRAAPGNRAAARAVTRAAAAGNRK